MTDHVRGDGPVELLEYGDFQCPYCRDAFPSVERVRARLDGRIRFAFRHFPITGRHPRAHKAAEAAEAAGAQGRFWEMHDALFTAARDALEDDDLLRYARDIGVPDVDRFAGELRSGAYAALVEEDRERALAEGVTGTPSFFVAGERHRGFYDVEALVDALEDAGA
jgi:protein-disulfide isomerase